MNILIFEYLTGGGFNREALPSLLFAEGALMLRALLDDCCRLDSVTVHLMLDYRCHALAGAYAVNTTVITADSNLTAVFQGLLTTVDAVWLVAPEFAGILQGLTEQVEAAGKRLLTASSEAVALTANKWETFKCLEAAGIATLNTALLAEQLTYRPGAWVIKPIDGVGCIETWRVDSNAAFIETLATISDPQHFIIQPFVSGSALSLCCLFDQGQSWVLCVNEQLLSVHKHRLKLLGCKVNSQPVTSADKQLAMQIAKAIPGLHGYVGIDLIQTIQGSSVDRWVVEINPRLTSSYVGLYQALGLNVVALVLQLRQQPPFITPVRNVQVDVKLLSETE